MGLYYAGLARRLKNIKGRKLWFIRFVIAIKYRGYFNRRINFNCNRLIDANRGIEHMAIHVPEGQLLILLKIVGNYNGAQVMDLNECTEVHAGVGRTVLLKMLH
jgi:hypothetical protein